MPSVGSLFEDRGPTMVRGEGAWLFDDSGKRYLDLLSGVAVTNLGHCHPRVTAAAQEQLLRLWHTTTLLTTEPMVAVAERLIARAPGRMARVFFCADGSGAVEGAMMAARRATGRPDFLAFDGALHGRTSLTLAATGLPFWHSDPFPPPVVHRLPMPGLTGGDESELLDTLAGIDLNRVAALIAEPVLGNGGVIEAPPGVLKRLRERLRERGVLFIADEAQTGFCRTGRWFGIERHDVEPDLLCVCKALANGLPAAAWLCTEAIATAMTVPTASTFGGNPVCMAAALETMQVLEEIDARGLALEVGGLLREGLEEIAQHGSVLGAPRGAGLMLGVPLAGGAAMAGRMLSALRGRGVLAGRCGIARDVLLLLPPLTLSTDEAAFALGAIEDAAREVAS